METGDNALIGGFIVTGTQPKRVIVRAIGPSLPLTGALADPTLELRDGSGALIRSNDNWRIGGQETEIMATTIPPSNDLESAIVETLPANGAGYTAIVARANNGTGIGLVEVYDLDQSVDSKLANISTRGLVQTGDNVLIAGTIVLGPTSPKGDRAGDRSIVESRRGNWLIRCWSCGMEMVRSDQIERRLADRRSGDGNHRDGHTAGRRFGVGPRGNTAGQRRIVHRDCAGREWNDRHRRGGNLRAELIRPLPNREIPV